MRKGEVVLVPLLQHNIVLMFLSLISCLDFEWSQFVDCVWKWITSICHVSTHF